MFVGNDQQVDAKAWGLRTPGQQTPFSAAAVGNVSRSVRTSIDSICVGWDSVIRDYLIGLIGIKRI